MQCTHQKTTPVWVEEYDPWDEVIGGHWENITSFTYEDITPHRYMCTQCKEVMYYSKAARDYFVHDIKSHIPGLTD